MFDVLLAKLETDLRAAFDESLVGLLATARTRLDGALAEIARERAKGLTDIAREKANLHREIEAMHKQKEAQEGHVVLNIGGYRYETSVQTLRRLPHTFFDAYFSGRYAQDVCADGSIFIDRDGEHFGQVLQYLRDGVVSVVEQDASELDLSMLRWLKREFGFYCIELMAEQQEVAFVAGGDNLDEVTTASVERYDVASGAWWEMAPMTTARASFALCGLGGELYAIGGIDSENNYLASVERYDPSLNSWSAAIPLPHARAGHCAVAVADAMYVLGGLELIDGRLQRVRKVLKFDSRAQFWSEVAPTPEPKVDAAACALGNEIYVVGGQRVNSNDAVTATTFCYNVHTDAWVTLAPMPEGMTCLTVCAIGGLIYVLSCIFSDNAIGDSVFRFDPVANSWSEVAPTFTPRFSCASFVLDGSIHVAGGWDGRRKLASVERYDAASDSWASKASMNYDRAYFDAHAMLVELNLFDSLILKAKSAQRLS
jgi:N-acetylneuraminic acid mutarotase